MSHKPHRHQSHRTTGRRGMTLIELLLAMMITAMVGAAIAGMLAAVSYGTDSSKDIRSLVARNKALSARVSAAIRGSKMVLDQGDNYLVLWMNDDDDNGVPSLLELRRINFDPGTGELSSYTAPDDAADVSYALDDDFVVITDALMGDDLAGTASFPKELWAKRVNSWTLALDNPDPQSARLVSYLIELSAGDMSDTALAAVGMRN